ncbi:MAG: transcription elongation factor GreA [Oscillospiraceae bacterium]|nr:transcription elongation factor GreA [Oscillospiraceae bacterium]MBQ2997655.1 transcription elongation factor GreA [Oscillospiraceae bacterium]MBQ3561662.1 transcription elongation factor GreA [Oscillospiraceae bacterium]
MDKKVVVTASGLKALEEELEQLKTVRRKEVSEKIRVARSYGDLSENSEYDEAKNEQAIVEARIADLEVMLKNVVILDESELVTDAVSLGSTVKLYDEEFEEELEYIIVGSTEADIDLGKISDESPVGKALIGKKAGEVAEAILPSGDIARFKVISIG